MKIVMLNARYMRCKLLKHRRRFETVLLTKREATRRHEQGGTSIYNLHGYWLHLGDKKHGSLYVPLCNKVPAYKKDDAERARRNWCRLKTLEAGGE